VEILTPRALASRAGAWQVPLPAMPAWEGEPMAGRVASLQFVLCPSCRAQLTDLRGVDRGVVFRGRPGAPDLRWPEDSQGKAYSRLTKHHPVPHKDLTIHIGREYRDASKIPATRPRVCNKNQSVTTCSAACNKISLKIRSVRCGLNSRLRAEHSHISPHLLIAQAV
jgi:hypothetical protein